ncbi:MAG: outer membrane protein assembly factor BamC [Halieaceae bacterium]|jgi:outer membrane protein assembly factor BamC
MRLAISARLLLIASPLILLQGCGYLFGDDGMFRDPSQDYRNAPELEVIDVPPGKSSGALREIYPIPEIEESLVLTGDFEVPRPTPLVAGAADEVVRIQKLGDDSWALVAMAPGQLWPQVRSFLSAATLQVARVDARAGIMETNWLELDGTSMGSRFRYRIERGVQRGTSELHVLQMNQAGDVNVWPANSDNIEQESEMLGAVAQYIANSADTAPVSMIADQAISASGRISLQESPEGYAYIELALPFNRGWASLAKALEDSSFEIVDRDRSAGEYYTRFLGPTNDEDEGWFGWLSGGDDSHPLSGKEFLVTVVSQSEDIIEIKLQTREPDPDFDKRQEQGLLSLIKGNIN